MNSHAHPFAQSPCKAQDRFSFCYQRVRRIGSRTRPSEILATNSETVGSQSRSLQQPIRGQILWRLGSPENLKTGGRAQPCPARTRNFSLPPFVSEGCDFVEQDSLRRSPIRPNKRVISVPRSWKTCRPNCGAWVRDIAFERSSNWQGSPVNPCPAQFCESCIVGSKSTNLGCHRPNRACCLGWQNCAIFA